MARIRYTFEEAKTKAAELALSFAAMQDWGKEARFLGASPDVAAHPGKTSKHPTIWNARFVFHPLELIVDGGDLWLTIDLETEIVKPKWG